MVFFGAHADDIELGAGGTCAKLCAAGFDVRIVVATDDRNGGVTSIRRNEATAAAGILGIAPSRVYFLGLTDGHFRCDGDAVAQVRSLFSALDFYPDAIFTHSEADCHQDHVELTRIVKAALRRAGIFKYRVSNSAISSHFRPSVSSNIADFADAKSAALSQHKSQVILGRVKPPKVSHDYLEAFELEIQEGAVNFFDILDRVNDAPFSRFWLPLCARGEITVIAPSSQPFGPKHSYRRVVSGAPSDLQLVTRLQNALAKVMRTHLSAEPSLTVEEATASSLDALPFGASLILGGPAVNPAAQPFLERISRARFRAAFASSRYRGYPIIDTHTGRLFEPTFTPSRRANVELERDYGLLTIARIYGANPAREASLVISAMGVHAAGTAATISCLLQPDHVACLVDDARRVIDGAASWAQWLVPCTQAGVPITCQIAHHVNEPRPPAQLQSAARPRAKRFARVS